ncbi:hypothetical protein M8J76_015927 [Diaphorina citri]|nr:hypothetical protein M8J76_015927 [Diaphorina citri]
MNSVLPELVGVPFVLFTVFTFAHAWSTSGEYVTPNLTTLQPGNPTGYDVKPRANFVPLVPAGRKATPQEMRDALCKVPKLQPNAVCMPLPEDADSVALKEQDYCNYLARLFSFKTSACATVTIEPADSEINMRYNVDACGISYETSPDPDSTVHWLYVSSSNENIPDKFIIGKCDNNPLILYTVCPAQKGTTQQSG